MPECELLMNLLLRHCGSLGSLALPSCAATKYVSTLAQCTYMCALRIEDLWTAQTVESHLPSLLERIASVLGRRTSLELAVDYVKKSATFTRVTMHVWWMASTTRDWSIRIF